MTLQVVVVGAGVVGASIAASLSERGASVTLIDRSAPGSGTSRTSFAWINANGKEPLDYFEINRRGVEAHRRLSGTGDTWLSRGGHVEIAADAAHRDRLLQRISVLNERGYPALMLTTRQASELLPGVRIPRDAELIAHFPTEGFAYPAIYLAHVLQRARDAGARMVFGNGVSGIRYDGRVHVALADGESTTADTIVVATGRWTAETASIAGISVPLQTFTSPGDVTVGYLAETAPAPIVLDHIVTSPRLNFRPSGGGRLLLQALDLDDSANPATVPPVDSVLASEFLRRLQDVVVGGESATIDNIVVGQRAMPLDGHTIAGAPREAPWLYVAVTHSGVTLAPFLGEAVAAELHGVELWELSAFRPDRFSHGTAFAPPEMPRSPGEQ